MVPARYLASAMYFSQTPSTNLIENEALNSVYRACADADQLDLGVSASRPSESSTLKIRGL